MTEHAATIVVCTRNRAASLRRCLESLLTDTSRAPREIVIVDNGSTDETARVITEASRTHAGLVRGVYERRAGLSVARNAGVSAARAPLLLFTDDDATVHDGWADRLIRVFDDPVIGAAGGRILVDWTSPRPPWLEGVALSNAALVDLGTEPFRCTEDRLPFGANLAFRREAIRGFSGPFEESLGHRGDAALGFEEFHLLWQILTTWDVVYEPDALVTHHVAGQRITYDTVRRRNFQSGFGYSRSERLRGIRQPDLARRIVRTMKVGRVAIRLRCSNAKRHGHPDAVAASKEFEAWFWWGRHLEMLCGRLRWTADWLASRFA